MRCLHCSQHYFYFSKYPPEIRNLFYRLFPFSIFSSCFLFSKTESLIKKEKGNKSSDFQIFPHNTFEGLRGLHRLAAEIFII